MAIPASNKFGVENRKVPVDFSHEYAPTTQTYHGFSIAVEDPDGREAIIGRITEWTPVQLSRPATLVRELNGATFGQPVDIVPGVEESFTLSFARAEVWNEEVERAFGISTDPLALLINQNRPFKISEVYAKPGVGVYKTITYVGCWFTSKNTQAFTAEGGDVIIKIDGEIMFVNRVIT